MSEEILPVISYRGRILKNGKWRSAGVRWTDRLNAEAWLNDTADEPRALFVGSRLVDACTITGQQYKRIAREAADKMNEMKRIQKNDSNTD